MPSIPAAAGYLQAVTYHAICVKDIDILALKTRMRSVVNVVQARNENVVRVVLQNGGTIACHRRKQLAIAGNNLPSQVTVWHDRRNNLPSQEQLVMAG